MATAKGTATDPWVLKTPPLTSAFTMHRDTIDGTDTSGGGSFSAAASDPC